MAEETDEEIARRRTNTLHYVIIMLILIHIMFTFFMTLSHTCNQNTTLAGFQSGCTADCDTSCRYAGQMQAAARENFSARRCETFSPDRLGACAQTAASPGAAVAHTELRSLSSIGAYPELKLGPAAGSTRGPLPAARAELRAFEKIGLL